MNREGMTSVRCVGSVRDTMERLVGEIAAKGMTVFARIDHAANASAVGLALRPTELVIFGNPKAGTLLMQDGQTSGIDLPVKILAWEDAAGAVWLTYNTADWLARRHALGASSASTVAAIGVGLAGLAADAAAMSRRAE